MRHKAANLPAIIFVLLFAMLVVAGCQRADVEPAAAVDETERNSDPATTESAEVEATSSEERGAVARAGDGKAVAKSGNAEASAGNGKAQAGDAVAGDGKARAGDVVAGGDEAKEKKDAAGPGKVKLKIGGEPGRRFSGTCSIGGEEREVSGQVPGRFVYEPEGRKMECEISNEGPDAGQLKFSVKAGGENQKQRIKVTGDTINFSFSGDGISYTTSSASGSNSSVTQKTKIISSSSSSVSSSSSSP